VGEGQSNEGNQKARAVNAQPSRERQKHVVSVYRPGGSVKLQKVGIRGRLGTSKDSGDGRDGVEPALLKGTQEAHQDRLGLGTATGAISPARLAIDNGGPNRVLSRPIGSFHVLAVQENEQSVAVAPQMLGQAQVAEMGDVAREQVVHLRRQ
jgi:hypothetical protein